jgi:thiamine-phosphate pyrophosphorylase
MLYNRDTCRIKKEISCLHYLTQDDIEEKSHADLAEAACRAGINWLQLRTKNKTELEWEAIALNVKKVTGKYNAKLIINDNPLLALKINADGVHLGKNDMDPGRARKILGDEFIIGGTANTNADILRLMEAGVDYIGLGPYRYTTTKKNLSPVLDIYKLKELMSIQNQIPVILIGGIRFNDIENIASLGTNGIAVSSAINYADNPEKMSADFVTETIKYFKK